MAGKITALEPQRHSSRRINVYLDGEFAFGIADVAGAHLRVGDWISDEEIETLRVADARERAREKALNYLSYRPRSEFELTRYLQKRGFSQEVTSEVIERLKQVDLVDDLEFARFWVENRLQFRPRGRRALSYELRQKGLSNAVIQQALEGYDEAAALERVARAQARRLTHLPPEKFRKRLMGRLARRGFSYDRIYDVLARYDSPHSNLSESEES
jgi:regulatory protein